MRMDGRSRVVEGDARVRRRWRSCEHTDYFTRGGMSCPCVNAPKSRLHQLVHPIPWVCGTGGALHDPARPTAGGTDQCFFIGG
jgi:hypothetical protein